MTRLYSLLAGATCHAGPLGIRTSPARRTPHRTRPQKQHESRIPAVDIPTPPRTHNNRNGPKKGATSRHQLTNLFPHPANGVSGHVCRAAYRHVRTHRNSLHVLVEQLTRLFRSGAVELRPMCHVVAQLVQPIEQITVGWVCLCELLEPSSKSDPLPSRLPGGRAGTSVGVRAP